MTRAPIYRQCGGIGRTKSITKNKATVLYYLKTYTMSLHEGDLLIRIWLCEDIIRNSTPVKYRTISNSAKLSIDRPHSKAACLSKSYASDSK